MSDPINLNKVRKAKQKQAQSRKAQENRVVFGLTKAERQKHKAETLRAQVQLKQKEIPGVQPVKKVDEEQ